jgi:SpoVK/Ycf46/Vps4 family AAA+-type ATPase
MSTPVENVMQAIRQASDLYHRLVLLAGPQGTGKTAILQALANAD